MASKAIPLVIAGGGAIFLWSAIEGKSWSTVLRNIISGKTPQSAANVNAITAGAATLNDATTSTGSTGGPISSVGAVADSGSNEAILQATAAKFGWTGAQWTCLNNVEMAEAGYNLTATNPSSGAYGMAQFINGPSEYAEYGGNSNTASGQAVAMCNYIKQRYGTPCAAWAHEQAYNWY